MITSNSSVAEKLDALFSREQGLYGTLEDLPLIWQKGHYRRMELLDTLQVGDVSDKVCVDFGTGSWGFAGIFPRLHQCKFAYGLDISKTAIEQSTALSRNHPFPYGKNFAYLQSDGLDLPFLDKFVDIIFSGESIEHVRFPRRFLCECHRILRDDGQLIITTPNRDALLYKTQNDLYCVGPEHFWLHNLQELTTYVTEFFNIEECMGFNGSLYRDLDGGSQDPAAAEAWSKMFRDQPELATGLVLRARKKALTQRKHYSMEVIERTRLLIDGPSQVLPLEFGLTGIMIDSPNSAIRFVCPPSDGVVLHFWTHAWSGIASVTCGGQNTEANLYTKDAGWRPVVFPFRDRQSIPVEIRVTGQKDPRALSFQTIFFEAFVYRI